jgi:hypothetical protein
MTGLDSVLGLDRLRFGDPSSVDMRTLRSSLSHLPAELLEQCGLSASEVAALKELFA